MRRQLVFLVLSSGVAAFTYGCATKSFVQAQLSASEATLSQRIDTQESRLREQETRLREQETKLHDTAGRAGASLQAIDQVGALASDAKMQAASAQDAQSRLSQRLADRNKFRVVETTSVYFESNKAEIREQDLHELEAIAKALQADANSNLELQGFADPRGDDRHNNELARERVEAVMRCLVQRYSVEVRQLRAVAMGKVPPDAGEKGSREVLAKARRVDIRLLAPWSTWEDPLSPLDNAASAPTSEPPRGSRVSSPTGIEDHQLGSVKLSHPRDTRTDDAPGTVSLREFLKAFSPKELGGEN